MNDPRQLLDRLGLRFPIIQAPMAGVSTPQLAAEVSNAGGLGSLGLGASCPAQAREAIEQTRALTERPFNVNVFCHRPAERDMARETAWIERLTPLFTEIGMAPPVVLKEIYGTFLDDDAMLQLLLELRPAVVSFHFGVPDVERIGALRQAGIVTLASATDLHEALIIERTGVDAVVAQGIEAGGHRSSFDPDALDERLSTAILTRLLVRRTGLPVIAAGGIADGASIRSVLDLGAVAAQLGTAFILCPESAASQVYRDDLKSPRAAHTCLTRALSGRPARGIVNRLVRFTQTARGAPPAAYPLAYDAAKQLITAAAKQGNHDFAAHWAGQAAMLVREMPAADLVATLVAELTADS